MWLAYLDCVWATRESITTPIEHQYFGCRFVCETDYQCDVDCFMAFIFCSETGKWWRTYCENGVMYWLDGLRSFEGMIAWNPLSCIGPCSNQNYRKCHLIRLPVRFSHTQPPSEGKACIGVVSAKLRIMPWLLVNEVGLKGGEAETFAFVFNPTNEDATYVVRNRNIYEYALQTGELEETDSKFLDITSQDNAKYFSVFTLMYAL
ncbi:hypothetical protein PanWU01x14_088350 [Parasponia andersonii]|uniref:Uncharacterized protein n=1 Tax=Parasponia andersonii TaxID=3476 RepID=A0A2P5D7Y4_PARAD|nr:hypothetical protein PanWU01x14_088350 [Parasponia andersonii]